MVVSQAIQYAKKVGHMEVLDNLKEYQAMQLTSTPSVVLGMPDVEEEKQDPMIEDTSPTGVSRSLPEVATPSKLNKSAFSKFSSYFKKKKLTGGCM